MVTDVDPATVRRILWHLVDARLLAAWIRQAVDGGVPSVCDSGVRRADHVGKALAVGATVVGMGRPMMSGRDESDSRQ